MSLPKFEHEWDGFKGQVTLKWDQLKDEDLIYIKGNLNNLIALISERYGEQKTVVEAKLRELYTTYLGTKDRISQGFTDAGEEISTRTQDFADNVKAKATELQHNAAKQVKKIREENIDPAIQKSEDYIKIHPFTTVLGALGVGLLVGGLLGLISKRN